MPERKLKLSIASTEQEKVTLILTDGLSPASDDDTSFQLRQTARTLARAIVYAIDLRMLNDFTQELEWAFDDYVGTIEPSWESFVLEE